MAKAEMTSIVVRFTWDATPEREKHAFMDELARLVSWTLNRRKGEAGIPEQYQLRWEGAPDDRTTFRFDVVGAHEQHDVRAVVADLARRAHERGVPVAFEFVRL